jgi:hypothetical protein
LRGADAGIVRLPRVSGCERVFVGGFFGKTGLLGAAPRCRRVVVSSTMGYPAWDMNSIFDGETR